MFSAIAGSVLTLLGYLVGDVLYFIRSKSKPRMNFFKKLSKYPLGLFGLLVVLCFIIIGVYALYLPQVSHYSFFMIMNCIFLYFVICFIKDFILNP